MTTRVRSATAIACATAAMCALAACGGGRETATTFHALTASDDYGVTLTAISQKERADSLVIRLRLENKGDHAVFFHNPESLRVAGFAVSADHREPQGADAGRYESTKSKAARLDVLAPGTSAEFEVRWTFEPALAHAVYPWTLGISNMATESRKLGDLTVSWSPNAP